VTADSLGKNDDAPVARTDAAASTHLLLAGAFLAIGAVMTLLALAATAFPANFEGVLAAGRMRPMAMTAVMLGGLVVGLAGAVYYLLPRLTGTVLWREDVARAGGWALAVLTVVGIAVVGLGLGDGVGPLSLPWWVDIPVALTLLVPGAVTAATVSRRAEEGVFVSLWFVMGAVVWLPILYIAGNLPNLSAMGRALQRVTFEAGFVGLWTITLGIGVAYYTVVKVTDGPLANRQLARVGFWSLAFAATWAGPAQLVFGPTPDWLDVVAATLTLALPVAALSNAGALASTIGEAWQDIGRRPALLATATGTGMVVLHAVAASLATFRSSASLVGLTAYWDGVLVLGLFGAGGLLLAGWAFQALTPMTGRLLVSESQAIRSIRLTAWGAGLTALSLVASGVLRGFAWAGTAYTDPGAEWGTAAGIADALQALSVLTFLPLVAGFVLFALVVFRTVTSGRAAAQEVLVAREFDDE
jgi:cytochrome c oxidase cbb3-type subunit 1